MSHSRSVLAGGRLRKKASAPGGGTLCQEQLIIAAESDIEARASGQRSH
jgi:hypothetical protein